MLSPTRRPPERAIPLASVQVDDAFWSPRLRVLRERTLPALYDQLLRSGRIDALRLNWRRGQHPVPHHFWDSDIAKWLEASSYSLATHPDAWLGARVDAVISLLCSAQQPDGYLNSYYSNVEPASRWTDLRDGHELYCAGHLIEAGVAHFLSSGQRTLLDVACRYADYIGTVFGRQSGQRRGYCGHPEVELALVRLYRATGESRYLELSRYFVDERGQEPYYFDAEGVERTTPRASDSYYRGQGLRGLELRRYNQSHAPVREQTRVVGHAVRAMYLYSAMADLADESADAELRVACERLWSHLLSTSMYVTGGIGQSAYNEGLSTDYDLPNADAYAESCASVGLVFWAHRMLRLTGEGRYADAMERTLYNAVAAAISSDGALFFYANPLASDGRALRQPWFKVACCPPNVARLLASLGQYVYSVRDAQIDVNLYVGGEARLSVSGTPVTIRQVHNYPWDGQIRLEIMVERSAQFDLRLRLPAWARSAVLQVNDTPIQVESVLCDGYLRLERTWHAGDHVLLGLPMPVERVYAHPAVAEDSGCVALQRGPIVFCVEQADNPAPLHALQLPRDAPVQAVSEPNLLGGIVTLQANALLADDGDWGSALYRAGHVPKLRPHALVAVPYAVWGNRAPGQMRVWIRDAASA
ncbi:MAG: glycoside hydrolase family 127 protein [Chloroflexi bacterium]|nr:glycoside hydrolase family 127 protein [Chloroflexota bacterium]